MIHIDMDSFKKNTTTTIKDGRISINCKKGLWGVAGAVSDRDRIQGEALHYFQQYYSDGEYDDRRTDQAS